MEQTEKLMHFQKRASPIVNVRFGVISRYPNINPPWSAQSPITEIGRRAYVGSADSPPVRHGNRCAQSWSQLSFGIGQPLASRSKLTRNDRSWNWRGVRRVAPNPSFSVTPVFFTRTASLLRSKTLSQRYQPACKPGFVGHRRACARRYVTAIPLGQRLRVASSNLPGRRA